VVLVFLLRLLFSVGTISSLDAHLNMPGRCYAWSVLVLQAHLAAFHDHDLDASGAQERAVSYSITAFVGLVLYGTMRLLFWTWSPLTVALAAFDLTLIFNIVKIVADRLGISSKLL